jgi:cell division protein FtsB
VLTNTIENDQTSNLMKGEGFMKRIFSLLFAFLFCLWGTSVFAADSSAEIDQLKQEVNKLLQRIEELEKKQTESEKKAVEVEKKAVDVEKKVAEVEKKAEKGEKKALKDRVHLSGEARFRILSAW